MCGGGSPCLSVGRIFEYIRIYSDIRIFVSNYSIFEYEYWKFDFSNIFIFDQKLSLVKGKYSKIFEYLSPITGYSNTNIRNLTFQIYSYSYSVNKSILALLFHTLPPTFTHQGKFLLLLLRAKKGSIVRVKISEGLNK